MALDTTSFAAALKTHYKPGMVEDLVYKKNPLFAMLQKATDMRGDATKVALLHGNPQNRSASFAQAQATSTTSLVKAFSVTRVSDYSLASIQREVMLASEGNADAFMKAVTTEIDGSMHALARSIATKLYRAGWGDIGRINATVTGTTLTLATASDIVNFEVGMVLQFAASQSADALRDSGDSVTVTAVNRTAGSMTVTPNLSGISGLTSGDYIFLKGDRQDSATPSRLCIAGLEAWAGASAPSSSESFFGVDRSVDATRLGGLRLDATGSPIEEALIDGAALVAREGGSIQQYFMAPVNVASLVKSLGAKVQYIDQKVSANVSFPGVRVWGGDGGVIDVVADANCPANRIFGVNLDHLWLGSIGEAVQIVDEDIKSGLLRAATSDAFDLRVAFYGNLYSNAPNNLINIQV